MKWTEYDQATGRIRQVLSGSSITPPGILEGVMGDKLTQYVSHGGLALRPQTTVTAAQAAAVVTLSGVAIGTVVYVTGDGDLSLTQDQTDGHVELTLPSAGTYAIDVEQFPELPFHMVVTVE